MGRGERGGGSCTRNLRVCTSNERVVFFQTRENAKIYEINSKGVRSCSKGGECSGGIFAIFLRISPGESLAVVYFSLEIDRALFSFTGWFWTKAKSCFSPLLQCACLSCLSVCLHFWNWT